MAVYVKNADSCCRTVKFRHFGNTRRRGVLLGFVLVPAGHVFKRKDSFIVHVALPHGVFRLAGPGSAPGAVPRHPPAPYGFVGVHVVHVGNGAVFAEGEDLG